MTHNRSARITIVTAGHLSTCPRMVKAADALQARGFRVRVVSASHTPWAIAADDQMKQIRGWSWTRIDCARATAPRVYLSSGLRSKLAHAVVSGAGAERAPLAAAIRAYSRFHDELAAAIAAEPADLIYAGTAGALAAGAQAAADLNVPYGLDLEDFHSGEWPARRSRHNTLAARIERSLLAQAAFLTAGSPRIAAAYTAKYGATPVPIHNTYSTDFDPTPESRAGPLRVYWFSQTIGPDRGLDHVVRALGASGTAAELHLRGRLTSAYGDHLCDLQRTAAGSLRIVCHEPTSPDAIVASAHGYDLGLSSEEPKSLNRQLCLGNKIFVYLAAGLPVMLSDTTAQSELARELGDAALLYPASDVASLAELFRAWAADPVAQRRTRAAARAAALRRWHWEHPADRGALLDTVEAVVGSAAPRAAKYA
jgi:glycosyltransferase involved in cell wall biosynthesis